MSQLLNNLGKSSGLNLGAVRSNLDVGLSFMKEKFKEVAKTTKLGGVYDDDEPSFETNDGEVLVRYFVQGGNPQVPDDEDNMFLLPRLPYYTKAVVLQEFPMKGEYHFRFKKEDDEFGFVWMDLPDLEDLVPCYQNQIHIKVLGFPDGSSREYDKLHNIPRPAENRRPAQKMATRASANASSPASRPPRNEDLLAGDDGFYSGSNRSGASNNINSRGAGGPQHLDDFGAFTSSAPVMPATSSGFQSATGSVSRSSSSSGASGGAGFNPSARSQPMTRAEDLNRDELVRKREEEKAQRIQEKLEKHSAARSQDESGKQERADAAIELKKELDGWALNPQDQSWRDVRTLLATIQDVIWEGSTWHPVSLGDLMMNPGRVKKCWQKAILISHPDRHNNADGKRRYRAERIFEAINESFKNFKP
ncbi:unnamed protein product [Amoebophrya sp. A25]|nr:unnamed protein product [Amoebophrya sp. A25]|eukprot:GSA25T00014194001.1